MFSSLWSIITGIRFGGGELSPFIIRATATTTTACCSACYFASCLLPHSFFFVEWGRWGTSPPTIAADFAASMTYLVLFILGVPLFCSGFCVVLFG